jgi:general secretion pathway protein H
MAFKKKRAGFSATELLVVLTLMGIVATMVIPSVGRTLSRTRLSRAASVVAGDLQLAQTTAARTRIPVRVTVDATSKLITIQNHVTPTTVYATRYFDKKSEYAVQTFSSSASTVVFYPNGRAASAITFTLTNSGETRTVQLNKGGQIRIAQ